jgi:Zn-dependent protease
LEGNDELVGKALELLKQGLVPFVEREMKRKHGNAWFERTLGALSDSQVGRFGNADQPRWDVASALSVMWNEWNLVFHGSLGQSERTLVRELRDARNRWAHQEPFSTDDAYRTLEQATSLLTSISAGEAKEVNKLKATLRGAGFDGRTSSSGARTGGKEVPAAQGSKLTNRTTGTSFELKIGWSVWLGVAALYVISFRALVHLDGIERVAVALVGPVIILSSILVHELGHAFAMTVAGMRVRKMVLEVWGGYTQGDERGELFMPSKGKLPSGRYFWTFVAGPGANFLVALIAFVVLLRAAPGSTTEVVAEVAIGLNIYLGVLNLIPVFPLDGGHVLRGFLIAMTGRRVVATLISATLSIAIGTVGLIYSYDQVMTDGIAALRWGLVGLFSAVVLFASLQALLGEFDR